MSVRLSAALSLLFALGVVIAVVVHQQWAPNQPQLAKHAPDGAVVVAFTGTDERIDALFSMLRHGAAERGFISGAESDAPAWLAETLPRLKTPASDVEHWAKCCVNIGTQASSTFQNALETRCWLDAERITAPVILITSTSHMRRAAAALRAFAPGREIFLRPVTDKHQPPFAERLGNRLTEFGKLLMMEAVLLLPPQWPGVRPLYGPWSSGCPAPALSAAVPTTRVPN